MKKPGDFGHVPNAKKNLRLSALLEVIGCARGDVVAAIDDLFLCSMDWLKGKS